MCEGSQGVPPCYLGAALGHMAIMSIPLPSARVDGPARHPGEGDIS